MKKSLQQGFSIMELMVVVGIIGVLASVAIPAYEGYVARSKVIEGLALAAAAKTVVSENAASGLELDSAWSPPFPTATVSKDPTGVSRNIAQSGIEINPANGEITITYTNKVATPLNNTLLLVPVDGTNALVPKQIITGGLINWQCHSANPPANNVLTSHKGTISPKLVPANCRN